MTNTDETTPDVAQPDAPARGRRVLRVVVGVIVALAVLYAGAWVATAALIKRQTAVFLDAQRNAGVMVTTGVLQASGFPGRVHVVIPDITVIAPIRGGGWTWQTREIRLIAWPLAWRVLDLDFAGTHRIAGMVSQREVPVWVSAGTATGHIELDGQGRMSRGVIALESAALSLSEGGAPWLKAGSARAEAMLLGADAPKFPPGSDAHPATLQASARLILEARDVTPPALIPVPVTGPIQRAAITAEITGPWHSGPLPQVLEAWRADGGTLEIREAVLEWPPVRIAGTGTVALDKRLQPEGAISLRIQGSAQVLDMLVAGGAMGKTEAGLAQLGLALMSRPNANGVPELSVPLTLQEREITAGPIALGQMREIGWPPIMVP